jgi:hypothetical protein
MTHRKHKVQADTRTAGSYGSCAIALFLLVSMGMGVGCVDLSAPWEEESIDGGRGDTVPGKTDGSGGIGGTGSGGTTIEPLDADQGGAGGGGMTGGTIDADQGEAGGRSDSAFPLFDGGRDLVTDSSIGLGDVPDTNPDVAKDSANAIGNDGKDAGWDEAMGDTGGLPADAGSDVATVKGLIVHYACENASGSSEITLPDISGNNNHGTLSTGPTPTGGTGGKDARDGSEAFSFRPGKVGNAIGLSAAHNAYIDLPDGLFTNARAMTIATWVKVNSDLSWQRIFDFSVDDHTFMYLATNSSHGNAVRFRIASGDTTKADGGEPNQILEGPKAVPVGVWTHVAVTLGDKGITIFFDGVQIAHASDVLLRPSDLGITTNNFIGRSIFPADPYLDGQIDEFQIYDRVLSNSEIAALAGR